MYRPSDEEFARHAASHSLHDPKTGQFREERLDPLRNQGVTDQKSLEQHAQKVMQASDTVCFRGAYGREVYANDRMNTMVFTNENTPEKSTVFYNDNIDKNPPESASQRLDRLRTNEQKDFGKELGIQIELRTGGSKALEQDRIDRPLEQAHQVQSPSNKPEDDPDPTKPGGQKQPQASPSPDEKKERSQAEREADAAAQLERMKQQRAEMLEQQRLQREKGRGGRGD